MCTPWTHADGFGSRLNRNIACMSQRSQQLWDGLVLSEEESWLEVEHMASTYHMLSACHATP